MSSLNKTFLPNIKYENRNWYLIDCKNQKLGRLATIVCGLLKGKLKLHYYPSIDIGDYVILINVNSLITNKKKVHHLVFNPGKPGNSLKVKPADRCSIDFTIRKSIKGMLAQTESKRLMKRLNIYNDTVHPHEAQNPILLDISTINYKDK